MAACRSSSSATSLSSRPTRSTISKECCHFKLMYIYSQINGFAFRDNMKEFMVAANETNVKVFSILEH